MKIILSAFMITLLLGRQISVSSQISNSSFTTKERSISPDSAFISYFNGIIKNDRVLLNWIVDKNEHADKFEVERSTDGKTFAMAALVFGTDQPDKAEYQFYEKNKKVKSFYRLKMIHKDHTVDYSSIITPEPFIAAH